MRKIIPIEDSLENIASQTEFEIVRLRSGVRRLMNTIPLDKDAYVKLKGAENALADLEMSIKNEGTLVTTYANPLKYLN